MDNTQYTPIFDHVIQMGMSLTDAAVFGFIWRYCQRSRGYCYASHKTIARALGIAERSVRYALSRLLAAGLIEDETPGQRNVPHRYHVNDSTAKFAVESYPLPTQRQILPLSDAERVSVTQRQNLPTDSTAKFADLSTANFAVEDTKDTEGYTCARSATWLPDVSVQAAVLFGGNGRHARDDAELVLQRSGWTLPSDELRTACLAFIRVTGIAPPRTRSARSDWIRSLTEHIEEYGTQRLDELYQLAMERLHGLTISRPGALTKTLPVVAQPQRRREIVL
jgi:hypothetical protein